MSRRFDAQRHLATLYTAALVGTGKPVQEVYDHKVYSLRGQSPIVVVSASGTDYSAPGVYGLNPASFAVDVFAFALYSDSAAAFTNEDAESQLADIEERIREVHRAHQSAPPYWSRLDYRGETQIGTIVIGGLTYKIEDIPLRLYV